MTLQEAEWHRCRYVKMWQEAERVGDTAQMQKAEDCLAEIDEQILKQEGE